MADILLVEDDYLLASTIADWLEFKEHTVEHVGDGESALEKLLGKRFELLVLDWNIPGLSGIQVCQRFRENGGRTPILMLTGSTGKSEEEDCRKAGADAFLAKPFELEVLSARIDSILEIGS